MASVLPCSCSGATAQSSPAFLPQCSIKHFGQPPPNLARSLSRQHVITFAAKKVSRPWLYALNTPNMHIFGMLYIHMHVL